LRRLEASTVYLPAPGAGSTFERADYVEGDPTAVEVPDALLPLTRLYTNKAHTNLLVCDLP
jgi:hypothetical protein